MELKFFRDFDFTGFWDDCDYSTETYLEESPTTAMIAKVERELGYKLPASYIELMSIRNGGLVERNCFPAKNVAGVGGSFVDFSGILGIGEEKMNSLLGHFGSKFFIHEWGYPAIGVAICDTPSAGHDMIFLDYRKCGPQGEPQVVHIDQSSAWYEDDEYPITFLARDFETFIKGLKNASDFPGDDD